MTLITILLVMILIFLIIIATQNSARGGMQSDCLHSIIRFTNESRAHLKHLVELEHDKLNGDDNSNDTNFANKK